MKNSPLLQNLVLLAGSLLFLAILLEIFFRFMPVYDGFSFVAVNEQQPIFHARPDRTITSSKDWDFYNARDIRINNLGFRNDQDYTVGGLHPLIAVIGDSYIEAVQVDYQDSFYGQLHKSLEGKARVYSFGYAGAPLSQYLSWAQYATQTFKADHLTFVIISNDFDESISWRNGRPGFHLYERCDKKTYCLKRKDYQISPLRKIVEASAWAKYSVYNLQIMSFLRKMKHRIKNVTDPEKPKTYVANALAVVDPEITKESKIVIDSFFKDLPVYTGLPARNINFVMDGRVYDAAGDTSFEASYFAETRRYFTVQAKKMGYTIIDMKPVFSTHFAKNGKRFETKKDAHWNESGHEVVANELHKHYNSRL